MSRLDQQLSFVVELDKLKTVQRQSPLTDRSRRENSAEHSWHLAVMAAVLAEYAGGPIDIPKTVRMLLVHDVVEIDAGDTFAFDAAANLDKPARERRAAERIFGLLPPEQAHDFRALWEEFEAVATPEAQFANALDRLGPFLQNSSTEGGTWRTHHVTRAQVMQRMEPIRLYLPVLWPRVLEFINYACTRGWVGQD